MSAFSNRSAIFKHLNENGLNFPGSEYLPLPMGRAWMLKGHDNKNILIRSPPSCWKCQAAFPVCIMNVS